MRPVSIVLAFAAGAALVATGLVFWEEGAVGKVQIQNRSGERIELVTVQVSGTLIVLDELKPSEKRAGTFRIASDSHYKIYVKFASGKTLAGSCGYVTHGIDSDDLIIVIKNGIQIADPTIGQPQKC